jgi:hypothetical protein
VPSKLRAELAHALAPDPYERCELAAVIAALEDRPARRRRVIVAAIAALAVIGVAAIAGEPRDSVGPAHEINVLLKSRR